MIAQPTRLLFDRSSRWQYGQRAFVRFIETGLHCQSVQPYGGSCQVGGLERGKVRDRRRGHVRVSICATKLIPFVRCATASLQVAAICLALLGTEVIASRDCSAWSPFSIRQYLTGRLTLPAVSYRLTLP